MSSTNRSNSRDNHISDYYVTPIEDIKLFLNQFLKYEPNAFNGLILDPCAGGDKTNHMSYPEALKQFGIQGQQIITNDIRLDSLAEKKADYLAYPFDESDNIGVIITNPPFNLALPIIQKALTEVINGGFVIMLLRLNFFGSKERFSFWEHNMPKYVFVHHKRMRFMGTKNTDSIEYAHFVWQKGHKNKLALLKVI